MTERKATVRFAPEGDDDGKVLEQKKTYIPGWNPSENISLGETAEWVSPPSVLPTVPTYRHDPLAPGYTDYVSEAGRIRVSDVPLKELPYNTGTGGTTMGLRSGQYVNRRGVIMQGSRGVLQGSVVGQLPALAQSHGEILASQVAAEQSQAQVPRIQVPYEPGYKRPAPILKTATEKESPVSLQAEEFEQKFVETPVAPESGVPAMLSRVNMNANKDANAAYNRFNRNVRPFLKGTAAATVKARRRGLFTGESKNSYRRTLKGQLYKLMRNAGAPFSAEEAIAELKYIHDLAENTGIPDRVVAERMKDWSQRYTTDMRPDYRVKLRSEAPDIVARLDQIASLFATMNPSAARRAPLQELALEAIRMANPESQPSRAESMTAAVRRIVLSPKLIRGKALYEELQRILTTYKDVVQENPSVGAAAVAVQPPPQRGFFSRTFGARNTAYDDRIQTAAQTLLRALEQLPTTTAPVSAVVGKPPPTDIQLLPAQQPTQPITPKVYAVYPFGTAGASPAITYKLVIEGPEPKITTIDTTALDSMTNINRDSIERVSNRDFFELYGQTGGKRKTTGYSRKMARRTRKQQKRGKQHGGATSLPLAWYQQGAQFQGTVAEPTGVGLAGASAAWVRSALPAQGGGSMHTTGQGGGGSRRRQRGGFAPSVMGAGFAEVGMRLLPAAAYMGYNQFQNYNKSRRTHRRQRK